MGKHEAPPFRMVIENGRLVPATQYDAERLDTYRRGTNVSVRFTEDKDRVLVRKWWAILGRAVKECKTPWKNKEQASEAIKLALGIVNYTKTVGGEFMAYPKSLTELDDPELQDAVNQMIDVVFNVTGIDPSVWRKHVEHIRDDGPDQPSASSQAADTASPVPPPAGSATNSTAPANENPGAADSEASASVAGTAPASRNNPAEPVPGEAASEAGDSQKKADGPSSSLLGELLVGDDAEQLVDTLAKKPPRPWARPPTFGAPRLMTFSLRPSLAHAGKVLKGEMKLDAARKYLEAL